MKKILLLMMILSTMLALCSCSNHVPANAPSKPSQPEKEAYSLGATDEDLAELTRITDHIWIHTTYVSIEGARIPSNGLVVENSEGLLLVDTPWNNEQTKTLLRLAEEKLKKKFKTAWITHAHDDRIGGIDALLESGIEVKSTSLTAQVAKEKGYQIPKPGLDGNPTVEIGGVAAEIFYPGKGHTKDNMVVWFPKEKLLFGGCLIKSMEAKDLGNTTEADTVAWVNSVESLIERYESVRVVVPGHGATGGKELLTHTLELLKKPTP